MPNSKKAQAQLLESLEKQNHGVAKGTVGPKAKPKNAPKSYKVETEYGTDADGAVEPNAAAAKPNKKKKKTVITEGPNEFGG